MAYITPIGSNPEQVEYRLGEGHGCTGPTGSDRQFSYHADGRERPLRWIGRALADLGIEAGTELTPEQFDIARALMRGVDPRTGEVLVEAKRGIPADAKVLLSPLVRTIHGVAREAAVSVAEVLGRRVKLIAAFEAAERAVARKGESARLRADEAGRLVDAAGLSVEAVWGEDVYASAAANLFEVRAVRHADGTVTEERVPRRVIVGNAGYDITFTLPKSLSLLLAFADEAMASAVERIYLEQVERTFAWVEETTAYGMRGKHGQGRSAGTVKGNGYAGWVMVHRGARPVEGAEVGDPHWHAHVSVANMTRGGDGKWSTVAAGGRDLMRHAPVVDHMLKAMVRHELGGRYGIRFERNARTGAWELAGIPDVTLRLFSKRHADIKEMLTELGYDARTASRAQDRIAEQRSRGGKGEAIAAADATLQHIWQGEELAAGRDPAEHLRWVMNGGIDPEDPTVGTGPGPGDPTGPGPEGGAPAARDQASAPTGRGQPRGELVPPPREAERYYDVPAPSRRARADADRSVTVAEIAEALLDPATGLTAHSRRFTRAEALWRVADALPEGFDSPEAIEAMTDAVLAHAGFIPLPGGDREVEGPNGEKHRLGAEHMRNARTYTTGDVVDIETIILRTARASDPERSPTRVTDENLIRGAVSTIEARQRYPLSDEQHQALRRLVTTGRMVDTVNGAPGTGKTTLMRAVRVVFEAAGYSVRGAATAAVAAQNLETESGISSRTVAHYLERLRRGELDVLRGVDVLIIDEANLTEDRDRATLYQTAARSRTRIIEIGDGRQLRGVGVGSLFARVHEIVHGAELTDNRRQAEEDERAAIAAWRGGRYAEALSIWAGKAHLVATETSREATAAMLARWWELRQGATSPHTEMRGLVMLASTNEQVRRLNAAAQALRLAEGELGPGWTYDVAGGERVRLHIGDHVLLRVNDRQNIHVVGAPVLNGYRAVVTTIDQRGTLTVAWQQQASQGIETHTARLSPKYVAIGGVELGYGMTVHKSEGLTVGDQWSTPAGEHSGATVLFHAAGADNPAAHVATSRHKGAVYVFAGRDELETEQDTYLRGTPSTEDELLERVVEKLADRARDTETHRDDRPVVVDLGIEEFRTEDGRAHMDHATAEAARAHAERLRAEHRAQWKHHARTRAERRAEHDREQHQHQEDDRYRREATALLLREVWRHEPGLAETIIAAAAFGALARTLHTAAEAGYDLREVLAEIPLATVASPRVHDPAAFTTVMVDIAVERIRSGQAERDAARRAERQRFELRREQVAELVREAWRARPRLAETVITAPAFDTMVRGLDHYAQAGLDVRGLLGSIPLATIASSEIGDKAAFSVYALHRLAQRHLATIEDARRAAEEHAERLAHQQGAAAVLREAWTPHPELAERVISGPAFGVLAERMTTAQEAGHDVQALLNELNAQALTAPHVPNPSATVAFAFTRALERADQDTKKRQTQPAPAAKPAETPVRAPEPKPRTQPGGAQATLDERILTPQTDHSVLSERAARRHWTQRQHGALTDTALRELVEREERRAAQLASDREAAERQAERLRRAIEAGQGREVRAVEDNLTRLRELATAVQAAEQLESRWHTVNERIGQAAEERARAEYELAGLSRLARSRRPELTQRIEELRATEEQAHREATELAERAALLHQQTGPRAQRRHIQTRARAAETDYPHAHQAAQRRDRETAELAHRRAARLIEQEHQHTQRLTRLHTEHQLREQLPDHARHIEDNERATTIEPAHANVGGPQVTGPQPTGPQPTQIQTPTGPDLEHAHEQQPEPQAGDRER